MRDIKNLSSTSRFNQFVRVVYMAVIVQFMKPIQPTTSMHQTFFPEFQRIINYLELEFPEGSGIA